MLQLQGVHTETFFSGFRGSDTEILIRLPRFCAADTNFFLFSCSQIVQFPPRAGVQSEHWITRRPAGLHHESTEDSELSHDCIGQ